MPYKLQKMHLLCILYLRLHLSVHVPLPVPVKGNEIPKLVKNVHTSVQTRRVSLADPLGCDFKLKSQAMLILMLDVSVWLYF